jgi:hypothetical protein
VLLRTLGNGPAKIPWMGDFCFDRSIDIDAGDGWLPVPLRISERENRTTHLDLGFAEAFRLHKGQSDLSFEIRGHAKNAAFLIHMNIAVVMDLVSHASVRDVVMQFTEGETIMALARPDVQDAARDVTSG